MCRSSRFLIPGFFIVALSFLIVPPAQSQGEPFAGQTAQHDTILNAIGAGPPCGTFQRFVVSQDGTKVCDNTTGLVWQQQPDNSFLSQLDALAHCPTLGAGSRLPEIKELLNLVDYSQNNPNLPADHPFGNLVSGVNYWSATTEAETNSERAWNMDFADGRVSSRVRTMSDLVVWCVRGGP